LSSILFAVFRLYASQMRVARRFLHQVAQQLELALRSTPRLRSGVAIARVPSDLKAVRSERNRWLSVCKFLKRSGGFFKKQDIAVNDVLGTITIGNQQLASTVGDFCARYMVRVKDAREGESGRSLIRFFFTYALLSFMSSWFLKLFDSPGPSLVSFPMKLIPPVGFWSRVAHTVGLRPGCVSG